MHLSAHLAPGVLALLLGAALAQPAAAADPTPRHRYRATFDYHVFHDFHYQARSFSGIAWTPNSLTVGSDGLLYGTADRNGKAGDASFDGAIYRVATDGSVSVLHQFEPTTGTWARSPLTLGDDGKLYGTAVLDGAGGGGVLFSLDTAGRYQALHHFDCSSAVGCGPATSLVRAADGGFYSTTNTAIYRFDPATGTASAVRAKGSELRAFVDLCLGPDGNLYGVGVDTLYRIRPATGEMDAIAQLQYGRDGTEALGVMSASDGRLYITTRLGGRRGGGALVAATLDGELQLVHSFRTAGNERGRFTMPGAPIEAADGHLYGLTQGNIDASSGDRGGSIWRLRSDGRFETVLLFSRSGNDAYRSFGIPVQRLTQTADGRLFGSSPMGGWHGQGALFVLEPKTPPAGR